MIITEIIRKLFHIEKAECAQCELLREMLTAERTEKGEYYKRLMIVLKADGGDNRLAVSTENLRPISGIRNYRQELKDREKASRNVASKNVADEWNAERDRVEAELNVSIQERGETTKANTGA
jgi:hypothetical protein